MVVLTREQLEERLAALHLASLELVKDLSLDDVLQRIVRLAREQAGARYAALGVVDDSGKMVRFIPIGMTSEEIRQAGEPPQGKGNRVGRRKPAADPHRSRTVPPAAAGAA
jgi:uncharacterized protein YigA (DUF484 family)